MPTEQYIREQMLDPSSQNAPLLFSLSFGSSKSVTASATLTEADTNKIIVIDGNDVKLTLPAASKKGLVYFVKLGAVTGGSTGVQIDPASTDDIDGGTTNKDLINNQSRSGSGDYVVLWSDGSTTWYTLAKSGSWVEEA